MNQQQHIQLAVNSSLQSSTINNNLNSAFGLGGGIIATTSTSATTDTTLSSTTTGDNNMTGINNINSNLMMTSTISSSPTLSGNGTALLQQQQQQQHQHQMNFFQQRQQNSSPVLTNSKHSQQQQQQTFNSNNHHQQLQRSISSASSSISPTSPILHLQQHHQSHHQHQHQHHHHHQFQQQQSNQLNNHNNNNNNNNIHQNNHHNQYHHQQHLCHQQNLKSSALNGEFSSSSSLIGNKSSCWCYGTAGSDATFHFKTLVPAVAAGAIIGKGGETIASLQRDTGARVKMSKSHDFYPGTSERVCLITGSIDAIMTVVEFIMDKIREKPDLTTKLTDAETKQAQERDKQVKILVPNSTAGMIIGKAGAYIKQIKEESGSYVQISQKPKDITLQERCITIIGDKDNNKLACKMIISKIVEDPQSGTCLNVSYADVNGPVANYNPTGSPYATNAISSSTASLNSALGTNVGGAAAAAAAGLLVNGSGINLSLNLGSPNPTPNPTIATQLLEHIKVAMRTSGYSDSVTTEVCAALGVLAKYGVLGVGVGLPHSNGAHTAAQVSYLGALEQSAAAASAAAAANSVFGALGQVNLEQYLSQQSTTAPRSTTLAEHAASAAAAAAAFDPFRHAGSQAATPISINNNSFGLAAAAVAANSGGTPSAQQLGAQTLGALRKSPTPGDLGAKDSKNVEVNEVIVGAIIGPNGRSLVEIQHVSGANIQISKKGIFAPGTRNRIVTITGQQNAIAMAQYLIEQRITEEETKRSRQNPLTNVIQ